MSAIEKTEAVVLKVIKYRETSKIVTFYTRQFGRLTGMVKGARQAKSKYGSSLQPLSYVSIVFYKKAGRDIQTVSQCDSVRQFKLIPESLEKMAIGMQVVELVNSVAHEEEENIPLFNLLVHTLAAVNDADGNPVNHFYSFEIHLCRILGFTLKFDACVGCGIRLELQASEGKKVKFHLDRGGPLCLNCATLAGQKVSVSIDAMKTLAAIDDCGGIGELLNRSLEKRMRLEIDSLLWSFLRLHVSGVRALKSEKVFSKILIDS